MAKIKICGLCRGEDIDFVNKSRPDYIGFIINFPKSHRSITLGKATELKGKLAPEIKAVGVFVNSPVAEIQRFCAENIIDLIQLHGHEDERYIESLKFFTDKPIIQSFIVKSKFDIEKARASSAEHILLDGGRGEGLDFPYDLIKGIDRPFFLAGGLTPRKIPNAIKETGAFALDISSGVECDKKKDFEKIWAAVKAAHGS